MTIKNILIVIFIVIGLYIVLEFRDHNSKRAIDACIAGIKQLEKTMNASEANIFCEKKILKKNKK
jgi:regulatory protein YycI of two-component signal transduction system YycFG